MMDIESNPESDDDGEEIKRFERKEYEDENL